MKNLTLITGGARSGKSVLAEQLATSAGLSVYYLATMERRPLDNEQVARIERHQKRRSESWITIEAGGDLESAIEGLPDKRACVLVDCLSLHVSRLLVGHEDPGADSARYSQREASILADIDAVLEVMQSRKDKHFLVVTNEVGASVVPDNELARAFRDVLGFANQRFAQAAHNVWLTVSGLPVALKVDGKPCTTPGTIELSVLEPTSSSRRDPGSDL